MEKRFFWWICLFVFCLASIGVGCSKNEDYLQYYEKGRALYTSQNIEEAVQYFEKTISSNKKHKQAYVMAAKCYYYLNRETSAQDLLRKVLKIYPDYVDANFWMGKISYFLKEYKTAESYLTKVIEEDSNQIDARYLLGDIYLREGEHEKALLNYSLVESNLDIIALSKVRKSEIYTDSQQYDKALKEISFIEKNRDSVDIRVLDSAYNVLSRINIDTVSGYPKD